MFYTDPAIGMGMASMQFAESTAYSRKGDRSIWEYYPDEIENQNAADGEQTAQPATDTPNTASAD